MVDDYKICKEGKCLQPVIHACITSLVSDPVEDVRRDLITATAAVSGLATVIFGLFTNLPVALA